MSLTDTKVKNARPAEKAVKLADGFGLYLLVHPNGSKYWQLGYRFDGKQKVFSIGVYPAVSLADARQRRDEAKRLLAQGIDPNAKKQADEKVLQEKRDKTRSFRVVAKSWFAIILPMILTEIFSPSPEIYLPFPLPASDCLYQPFSQNISRLKFILPPALNLYGVMSQNYLPSACQFFTFHQTLVHSHCGKVTAFDLCNYRQSCAMPGQSRD